LDNVSFCRDSFIRAGINTVLFKSLHRTGPLQDTGQQVDFAMFQNMIRLWQDHLTGLSETGETTISNRLKSQRKSFLKV
jgi:hypothetical protein